MRRKIEIWQTDDHDRAFTGSEMANRLGIRIVKDKSYKKVFDGEVDVDENDNAALENIFARFQGKKPEGYSGRSVSVSDLITLDGKTYFTDDYGFKRMSKSAVAGSKG